MAESFFESIREILSIQRWNFVPRTDDWSEAENIAYHTHLAFAVSKCFLHDQTETTKIFCRCLLKSFNKHRLSDIPISTRDIIKNLDEEAWVKIIDDAAKYTARFFPRELREFISSYMQYEMQDSSGTALLNEEIIKFCQYQSAWEECENNARAFPIHKYTEIKKSIEVKLLKLKRIEEIKEIYESISDYAESIRLLKHVRRWNRLNRNIQSSVMAHTFVVSMLALFFSKLENQDDAFVYEAILRALFHDVPESITGDIITPVKEIINKDKPDFWNDVERQMAIGFKTKAPVPIQEEISRFDLLHLSSNAQISSPESLVKDCDKFALVLECAFEKRSGNKQTEMIIAQPRYIDELRNSEWPRIREYAGRIIDEFS